MHKLETNIAGRDLFFHISTVVDVLQAKPASFETPIINSFSFHGFGTDGNPLIFHQNPLCQLYQFQGFGLKIRWSERVAMGGQGAFLSFTLYVFQQENAVEIAAVTFVHGQTSGTYRYITVGQKDTALCFSSVSEMQNALCQATTFVDVVIQNVG